MNSQHRRMIVAVCFGMIVGPVLGPRIGDWVAGISDNPAWEALPWLLIGAIWIGLFAWLRSARHSS